MAKQNEKQHQQQITGFHLGGLIPLDRVGYVLAALYENAAENLQIAPLAPDPRPQKQTRRLSDVSGIAGLLAPPPGDTPPAPVGIDRIQALIEIVSAAPPEGLKKNEIAAALKAKGVSVGLLEGSTLQGLVNDHILKRVGFGMYGLGKAAKSKLSESQAPQQSLPFPEGPTKTKREAILDYLVKCGPEGAKRNDIRLHLSDYGFETKHFDINPLTQLLASGHIVTLGRGRYAAVNPAPPAKPAAVKPSDDKPVKQTLRSHILSYLRESAPKSRTVKEITEKLNGNSVGTSMSVGVELSQMFNKKLIARPAMGTYALLPE